jgi:hypothetical protein
MLDIQLVKLLKEFKDISAWSYEDLKGLPLEIAQHQIELDTTIPKLPIKQGIGSILTMQLLLNNTLISY